MGKRESSSLNLEKQTKFCENHFRSMISAFHRERKRERKKDGKRKKENLNETVRERKKEIEERKTEKGPPNKLILNY